MLRTLLALSLAALATAPVAAWAQTPTSGTATGSATIAAAGTAAGTVPAANSAEPQPIGGEPAVQRQVLEDDNVRIEELRVRGVTLRVVVRPKMDGVREYEILPGEPGRDSAQDRRSAGQRVWRLLSF